MANEEHLALLKQGVDAWNEWKANNPDIRPDLSFAMGKGITISGAKLSGVDLSRANLSRADLNRADLIGANLSEANLKEAYLSGADLIGANLTETDLISADLIGANLIGANLIGAKLNGTDLSKANLSGTDLTGAKLIGAKLSGTNLSGAKLSDANLTGAYLKGANLKGANLNRANLTRANLTRAYLQRTKALDTNFKKAVFTGTCLEDWHTNYGTKLDEVICEYVYLRGEQKERRPREGKFTLGEFTRLFQKPLETVDLVFYYGFDWQAFFNAFQKLQVEGGRSDLSIQAIENKNNDAFVIRINVPFNTHRAEIEDYLKREYDHQLKAIDRKYRYQLQAAYEQIATYRQQSADLTEILKVMAGRAIALEASVLAECESVSEAVDRDLPSPQNDSLVNRDGDGSQPRALLQDYTLEQKQSLVDTAAKIQKLLQQLEQTYPTSTPLEKQMMVVEVIKRIESNPTLKAWVVGAMKGVSTEALKELVNHPLVNVLLAALEGYQEMD
jgi:uncharacterized protein YjbI with pentapeptide repeats